MQPDGSGRARQLDHAHEVLYAGFRSSDGTFVDLQTAGVKMMVDSEETAKYAEKRNKKVGALTETPVPHISIREPEISLDDHRKLAQEITRIAGEAYGIPKEKFMIHIFRCPKENIATAGVLVVYR